MFAPLKKKKKKPFPPFISM